jgi:hypothetical protein
MVKADQQVVLVLGNVSAQNHQMLKPIKKACRADIVDNLPLTSRGSRIPESAIISIPRVEVVTILQKMKVIPVELAIDKRAQRIRTNGNPSSFTNLRTL